MKSVSYLMFSKRVILTGLLGALGCSAAPDTSASAPTSQPPASKEHAPRLGEVRFASLRQLTFKGSNTEARFGPSNDELIFQSTRQGFRCDQIYRMNSDGSNKRLVSTGLGRTSRGSIFTDGQILYASSHRAQKTCPPRSDDTRIWSLQDSLDIFMAKSDGSDLRPLAPYLGYDDDAVVSPDGKRILFTSTRGGDVDIWSMAIDGSDLKQLTYEVGYDGKATYGPDGAQIVYSSYYPQTALELKTYQELLAKGRVRPQKMDLRIMDADGGNQREILDNGAANMAPTWHHDGARIVFSSDMDDVGGQNFDLYLVGEDGVGVERITFDAGFDGSPVFSSDGARLVFASGRSSQDGATNLFVADWNERARSSSSRPRHPLDATRWAELTHTLTSAKMAGRGLGTPGLAAAADIIAQQFQRAGLKAGTPRGFLQTFQATTQSEITRATLSIGGQDATKTQFRPLAFSASGVAEAEAIFVGYGLSSATYGYDDYDGVDAEGKIVVAFRYEPQRLASDSFLGALAVPESDLRFKAINALHRGAKGLVLINPPPQGDEVDALYSFEGAPSEIGIPVVHMSWAGGRAHFGQVIETWRRAIDRDLKPHARPLNVSVKIDVSLKRLTSATSNVVGKLDGTSAERPPLVIGAHYDHLGHGGEGSRAPGSREVHPGADDNASGVALLVELARSMSDLPRDRDIYFVAFTGEESGLLGSHWFVEHSPFRGPAVAMINLDMVGRLRDRKIMVLGTGTATQFPDMLRRAQFGTGSKFVLSPDGYGASDHMSFYAHGMPVLAFFTGMHDDYHRPTDTADKLNPEGAIDVGAIVFSVAAEIVGGSEVTYQRARVLTPGEGLVERGEGRYGPSFGSIPAFKKSGVLGVVVSGTKPGSPAESAGLKSGDTIVRFGAFEVTSLKDFAFALRQHQPGDTVVVVVRRGDANVELRATLGESR